MLQANSELEAKLAASEATVEELRIERQVLEAEHQRLLSKLIDAPLSDKSTAASRAQAKQPCSECEGLRDQLRQAGKRLAALQVQVNRNAIKTPNLGQEQLELELERALQDAEAADNEVVRLQAQVQELLRLKRTYEASTDRRFSMLRGDTPQPQRVLHLEVDSVGEEESSSGEEYIEDEGRWRHVSGACVHPSMGVPIACSRDAPPACAPPHLSRRVEPSHPLLNGVELADAQFSVG